MSLIRTLAGEHKVGLVKMQLFKRYGFFIITLAAVLFPFMFYTSDLSLRQDVSVAEKLVYFVTRPIQSALSQVTSGASRLWNDYIYLVQARQQARDAREENTKLNVKIQMLQEIRLENERLRKLLHFVDEQNLNFLSGSVQSGDPSFLYSTLRLNRGEKDQVMPGMGVVASQGVVGTVMRTFSHHSDVLLVVDRNSDLDVIVARNRRRGIVQGFNGDKLRFKYLEKGSRIQLGDELMSSGLTGVFPRGLQVGKVTHITYEADGVTQLIEVEPAVEFSSLTEALILTRPSYEMEVIQKIGGNDWMKQMDSKPATGGG